MQLTLNEFYTLLDRFNMREQFFKDLFSVNNAFNNAQVTHLNYEEKLEAMLKQMRDLVGELIQWMDTDYSETYRLLSDHLRAAYLGETTVPSECTTIFTEKGNFDIKQYHVTAQGNYIFVVNSKTHEIVERVDKAIFGNHNSVVIF